MHYRAGRRQNERGVLLITTLLFISLFMVYSNSLTLRTMTQRLASDRLRDRTQAVDLAQGAIEQLRAELYDFLTKDVQMAVGAHIPGDTYLCSGDAICAYAWLDQMGQAAVHNANAPKPLFIMDNSSAAVDGIFPEKPRLLAGLPTIPANGPAPRAWIVGITLDPAGDPANPLVPRLLTLEGEATVNGITKHVRAVYQMALGPSDIFRYAYFLNNYGWIDTTANGNVQVAIHGEIRSNGNLDIQGRVSMNGDLYASKNPTMGADGTIAGSPYAYKNFDYWIWHPSSGRPARNLALLGAPASKTLPLGFGYDNTAATGNYDPLPQRRYERQAVQTMPYLGDLTSTTSTYRKLANQVQGSLKWTDPGADGKYEWWGQGENPSDPPPDDVYTSTPITDGVYKGPDGVAGVNPGTGINDDMTPLVVIGSPRHPIVINGPVVVPGDVIIRGQITGRGTIYAGRNIHVVDGIAYRNKPKWPTLERDKITGRIRERCVSESWKRESNLGTVCKDGSFHEPNSPIPSGCMQ